MYLKYLRKLLRCISYYVLQLSLNSEYLQCFLKHVFLPQKSLTSVTGSFHHSSAALACCVNHSQQLPTFYNHLLFELICKTVKVKASAFLWIFTKRISKQLQLQIVQRRKVQKLNFRGRNKEIFIYSLMQVPYI